MEVREILEATRWGIEQTINPGTTAGITLSGGGRMEIGYNDWVFEKPEENTVTVRVTRVTKEDSKKKLSLKNSSWLITIKQNNQLGYAVRVHDYNLSLLDEPLGLLIDEAPPRLGRQLLLSKDLNRETLSNKTPKNKDFELAEEVFKEVSTYCKHKGNLGPSNLLEN